MILKNPKIMLWLFLVIVSIILISPNPFPNGYIVKYIEKNSTVTGVSVNNIIYKIDGKDVDSEILKQEFNGIIKIDTNKGQKYITANGTLGMTAEKVQPTNLNFGLDFKGGVRALVEPVNVTDNTTIERTISTLQTRINIYGLREANFRSIYHEKKGFVEITMAGGSEAELRELLEHQGKFEAKVPISIRLNNKIGSITLDKNYVITLVDEKTIEVDNERIGLGDSFTISGIRFALEEIRENGINITSTVFSGNDIKIVYFDPQRSRVERLGENSYRWYFSVQISKEGAERFAMITRNIEEGRVPGEECYLKSKIYLYLDDKLIEDLNIACGLKGKTETEISITGGDTNQDRAVKAKTRLQSILRSGALPTEIKIVSLDRVSPNLGEGFLRSALFAGLAAVLMVSTVVIVRYGKIKLVVPMLIVSLSEVLIILGMSVLINWTIDLAAIAGIIATVGIGIDSQIIIIDQALRGEAKTVTLKEKLERAFFIIFGAGGTVIAAMLPLMVLGFGLLRGFAIVTMIGVLAGILVARPAFGVLVTRLVEKT